MIQCSNQPTPVSTFAQNYLLHMPDGWTTFGLLMIIRLKLSVPRECTPGIKEELLSSNIFSSNPIQWRDGSSISLKAIYHNQGVSPMHNQNAIPVQILQVFESSTQHPHTKLQTAAGRCKGMSIPINNSSTQTPQHRDNFLQLFRSLPATAYVLHCHPIPYQGLKT